MGKGEMRLSRRGLLGAAAAGAGLSGWEGCPARAAGGAKRCILLFLVGGPSQLDTWDPKPEAPAVIRGPFAPLETSVPGIRISELFPQMARHADKYALVRSVHHTAGAVHDTGHQLLQTGRLFEDGPEHPHMGCVASQLLGGGHVILPAPIGPTGGRLPHGQGAAYLGREAEPFVLHADPSHPGFGPQTVRERVRPERRARLTAFQGPTPAETHLEAVESAFRLTMEREGLRERYGLNRFGQSCLLARRLVERGTRFVTVNMFETVFNETTWDIHGSRPFTSLSGYRDEVAPMFDRAYSALLEDLAQRGMLEDTLVVAMGELGRTPRLNPAGGRDHWPHCWTVLFAGGGVRGGQVVGASDASGAYPRERPVTPPEVVATVYRSLGIELSKKLPRPEGAVQVVDPGVRPIRELFGS